MKKPVMMETMTCISGIVVVPVVVGAVVAGTKTAVVGAVVVGAVVAGTKTVVVGAVVAVWSMRRMRITMITTVGTIALVLAAAMIMMMAAIRGQAAAILIVMIAAG